MGLHGGFCGVDVCIFGAWLVIECWVKVGLRDLWKKVVIDFKLFI